MSTVLNQSRPPGRPPKPGQRERINPWLRVELVQLLKQDAKARGMPYADRLSEILAAHYATEEGLRART
jgi:hypothetical protein